MSIRCINIDRDTPLFLPPDIREWVPQGHIANYIMDAVGTINPQKFSFNERGTGNRQYPPSMMLSLLIYCYSIGVFSGRKIEMLTHESVSVRVICAGTHPDHDTICAFRKQNLELFAEVFVKVLELAKECRMLEVGNLVLSADGTKIEGNASKHKAVSYEHSTKSIERLQAEVSQLIAKGQEADATPLAEGLTVPDEIARRQDRIAALKLAQEKILQRKKQGLEHERAEYHAAMEKRREAQAAGKKLRGKAPVPPSEDPDPKAQYNFTDPESRIMKASNGAHFVQAYNAQAVVETSSRLVVGARVCDRGNDKQELCEDIESVPQDIRTGATVLVDSGFMSQKQVELVEGSVPEMLPTGVRVLGAVGKAKHGRSVEELEVRPDPPEPPSDASFMEKMTHRVSTASGQAIYKLRKETVEPIFGNIKSVLGFRRFSMRGRAKAQAEWFLVCAVTNLRRMFVLTTREKMAFAA